MSKENGIKPRKTVTRTEDVDLFGPEKYVNKELDHFFNEAKQDPDRPKDAHVGWWTVRRMIGNYGIAAQALMDLPFRFEGELDPINHLTEILSQLPDPTRFADNFINGVNIYTQSKQRQMSWYEPDEGIYKRVMGYYDQVLSVLSHFRYPDEYPTPRSRMES